MPFQGHEERATQLLKEELLQPERVFYVSFASPTAFLGGIVMRGHGITDIIMRSHELHINPGGQALCFALPPEVVPPESYFNRLLTKEEVFEMFNFNCTWEHEKSPNRMTPIGKADEDCNS